MRMLTQREYWSIEALNFDAIYSHQKSKLGSQLDKVFRWAMYKRFEYAMLKSEPIHKKTFLDAGCGTGFYSLELGRRGALRVVGIDVSPTMLTICRNRAKAEHLDAKTDFILTDIMDFNTDHLFDICIGMGLLDYIKNPLPTLIRMKKLTREKVMLSFPVLWNWRTIPRKIRLHLRGCPVYFYTERDVRRLMKDAGFRHVEIRRMGPMYFVTGS